MGDLYTATKIMTWKHSLFYFISHAEERDLLVFLKLVSSRERSRKAGVVWGSVVISDTALELNV